MKKAKLEIIRVNEDVIATSCSNAVFFGCPSIMTYNPNEFSSDYEAGCWYEDLALTDKGQIMYDYILEHGVGNTYHLDKYGNIEVCNHPELHDEEHGWNKLS